MRPSRDRPRRASLPPTASPSGRPAGPAPREERASDRGPALRLARAGPKECVCLRTEGASAVSRRRKTCGRTTWTRGSSSMTGVSRAEGRGRCSSCASRWSGRPSRHARERVRERRARRAAVAVGGAGAGRGATAGDGGAGARPERRATAHRGDRRAPAGGAGVPGRRRRAASTGSGCRRWCSTCGWPGRWTMVRRPDGGRALVARAGPCPATWRRRSSGWPASDDVRRIAVMPDVHLSADVCIGTVVATGGTLYPERRRRRHRLRHRRAGLRRRGGAPRRRAGRGRGPGRPLPRDPVRPPRPQGRPAAAGRPRRRVR